MMGIFPILIFFSHIHSFVSLESDVVDEMMVSKLKLVFILNLRINEVFFWLLLGSKIL